MKTRSQALQGRNPAPRGVGIPGIHAGRTSSPCLHSAFRTGCARKSGVCDSHLELLRTVHGQVVPPSAETFMFDEEDGVH